MNRTVIGSKHLLGALAVAAAAMTLTACNGNGTSSAAGSSASNGSQSPSTGATGGSAGTDGSTGTTGSTGAQNAGSTGASGNRCHTSGLKLTTEDPGMQAGGQTKLDLLLTNTSGHTCVIKGFPGVDLKGPNDATFGPTYSLPRSSATATAVTLKPGASAAGRLTFLPAGAGEKTPWKPTSLVLTPPNETTHLTIAWTGPAVLRQDGATHPGTFVGPFQAN